MVGPDRCWFRLIKVRPGDVVATAMGVEVVVYNVRGTSPMHECDGHPHELGVLKHGRLDRIRYEAGGLNVAVWSRPQ